MDTQIHSLFPCLPVTHLRRWSTQSRTYLGTRSNLFLAPESWPRVSIKLCKLRILIRSTTLLFVMMLASGCQSQQAALSNSPLTAEELEVYGSFLDTFTTNQVKNLSNRTSPFDLTGVPEGSACLRGIEFENLPQVRREVHAISTDITKGRDLKLVDPIEQAKILQKEALVSASQKPTEDSAKLGSDSRFMIVSEIAFDKKHQFAVLKYVAFCGARCKYGATLVLEKVSGRWTATTRRPCALNVN